MDTSEWTTLRCTLSSVRELLSGLTRARKKFPPSTGMAIMTGPSFSWNSASATYAVGARCMMAG
jgi:hypothetical protein